MTIIDYYNNGEIKIGDNLYDNDLIVCPNKILNNWSTNNPFSLKITDLQSIISERPAFLVIGYGQENKLQVDDFTQSKLKDLGFDVYIAKTRSAVKKFNEMREKKKTIGVFHLS